MARPDADAFVAGEDPGRSVLLTIPSRMEMLAVVDGLVQAIVSQLDLDEDTAIAVATSVVEAGTNAIQHGHGSDEKLPVRFRFVLGEGSLDVWVRDTGPGFDPSSILASDPTSPEDILKARGRGIFIMRSLMDEVEFEVAAGEGTTVHLVKYLGRGNGSSAVVGD
jgi:anti-sigma regulatory factor (Ser/Thr protein kinase)